MNRTPNTFARRLFRAPHPALVRAAVVTAAILGSVLSALAAETEVVFKVKDEAGQIQVGVMLGLAARDEQDHSLGQKPFTAKTNKKGEAFFPFLPYNGQGGGRYGIALTKDGWFIKHFKIESRQIQSSADSTGTLVQTEDSGASPNQQDKIPSLIAKPGGKATIELVIAETASYRGVSAAAAADAAPAAGAAAAPAAPAPPPPPADPIQQAKMLMSGDKLDEAEAVLTPLKESKPSADLDYAFAQLYHKRGKEDDAAASLRAALAKDPNYPKAHYELGRKAYEEGRTDEAIAHFEAETKAHPEDEASLSTLASLYIEAGRTPDAIRVYESVLTANPGNTDALVALDGLYTAQGNQTKSDEAFQKVVAANPTGADAVYYKVGVNIIKRRDLSESDRQRAVAAFEKAIKLNPKNEKAHRELGWALIGLNKIDDAKVHFKKYLELSPTATDAGTIRSFLAGG